MKKLHIILRALEGMTISVAIWFMGWLIYAYMDVWAIFAKVEYTNILIVLMAASFVVVAELTRRNLSKMDATPSSDPQNHNPVETKSPVPKGQPSIQELKETIETLTEKVNDLHAFAPIVEKREEDK